jgi:hypothetical protein
MMFKTTGIESDRPCVMKIMKAAVLSHVNRVHNWIKLPASLSDYIDSRYI